MTPPKLTCPNCKTEFPIGLDGKFPVKCFCGQALRAPADSNWKQASALALFWFLLGVAPAFLMVPLGKHPPNDFPVGVAVVTVTCCLAAGLGFLFVFVKHWVLRIVLGLITAGFFLMFNIFVALFVGCATHLGKY